MITEKKRGVHVGEKGRGGMGETAFVSEELT